MIKFIIDINSRGGMSDQQNQYLGFDNQLLKEMAVSHELPDGPQNDQEMRDTITMHQRFSMT